MFYYPIELHYSQTDMAVRLLAEGFYYPIELHYSQTALPSVRGVHPFYYPIELHYSQTANEWIPLCIGFITL